MPCSKENAGEIELNWNSFNSQAIGISLLSEEHFLC